MSDNILQRFRDKFIDEAIMLLDRLEKDLLELEKTPDEKELLESAFRAMHTLKGVSGMYGFDYISEFTHILENIYQSLRDKTTRFNKNISDLSFEAIDHIRKLLDDEKLTNHSNKERHGVLLAKINAIANVEKKEAPKMIIEETENNDIPKTKQSWYIILNTNEQIFFRGVSLTNIFKELSVLGEFEIQRIPVLGSSESDSWGIVLVSDCSLNDLREVFMFIEDDCQIFRITRDNIFQLEDTKLKKPSIGTLVSDYEPSLMDIMESPDKFIQTTESPKKDVSPEQELMRQASSRQQIKRISVDAGKLDHLMYLVSELITVNSQLMLAAKDKRFEELRPHIENVDTLSKKFRNNALEIRLVPLSDIALRFQRLIRDLSAHLEKKIEFLTEGIDTELDKNMIDMLAEPLMHIIRNSIDHGIETPDKRKIQGKSEAGIIKLSATQSGNYVFIEIKDDGGGIDIEKVRQKAVEKGIISASDKPGEKEIFDFIFLPGFSTANSLTEVSGRGVGMDVVKKKIADLRGEIIINSKAGEGTSFTLKLQQSVAIIDTLLFKVEDTHLIVPMSEIEICIQEDATWLEQREHIGTIPFGDQLIYFVNLRQRLELPGSYKKKVKIIIVKKNDNYLAILADTIIGEHQAVLKPMGRALKDQKCLMAASQLGDGNLSFMLDTSVLYNSIDSNNN